MKYGKSFERDYSFYERHVDKFTYPIVKTLPNFKYDENGASAKEAFHRYDSNGILVPTREVEKLRSILVTKQVVNFHLKMWAEGYGDMLMGVHEYMEEFIDPPEWVERSFRNQLAKTYFETCRLSSVVEH